MRRSPRPSWPRSRGGRSSPPSSLAPLCGASAIRFGSDIQFCAATALLATPFRKQRADMGLDHHIKLGVGHGRDFCLAVAFPFDIAARFDLAFMNEIGRAHV